MNLETETDLLNNNGHINEKGISLTVESLSSESYHSLPAHLTEHIEDCFECKKVIMENYTLIQQVGQCNTQQKLESQAQSNIFSLENLSLFFKVAAVLAIIVTGVKFVEYLNRPILNENQTTINKGTPPTSNDGHQYNNQSIAKNDNDQNSVAMEKKPDEIDFNLEKLIKEYNKVIHKKAISLSTFAENQDITLPEAFKENPILQKRAQYNNTRSQTGINIVQPANNKIVKNIPIVFEWKNAINNGSIFIINNSNKVVWQRSTDGTKLICSDKLEPGLYYWDFRIDKKMKIRRTLFVLN